MQFIACLQYLKSWWIAVLVWIITTTCTPNAKDQIQSNKVSRLYPTPTGKKQGIFHKFQAFYHIYNSYTAELQALGHLITYIILPCKETILYSTIPILRRNVSSEVTSQKVTMTPSSKKKIRCSIFDGVLRQPTLFKRTALMPPGLSDMMKI